MAALRNVDRLVRVECGRREIRESGHDVFVALFDAIAGAITRDESTLHWAASRPGRLRAAFSPLVRRPCDLPPTAPLHRIAGTKARACVLNA